MASPSRPTGPARPGAGLDTAAGSETRAAPDDVVLLTTPEAADSFSEYLRAWILRIRSGESGMLPVLAGLVLIIVIFQSQSSAFLSAGNITNLLVQGAQFVLLGMAEVFVLLLGEIDLSVGYVAGVGAVVTVALASPAHNFPWWLAVLGGLAVTAAIGAFQGTLITRLRLPSFVVTLAGLLGLQGVLIFLANREGGKNGGGTIAIHNSVLNDFANGNMSPLAGWISMAAVVVGYAAFSIARFRRRRAAGLVVPPAPLIAIRIGVMAGAGIALVAICNTNRGRLIPLRGVPWVVPIVLAVLAAWTLLLSRTRYGRYVYAIGGNSEAARRAGINLTRIRIAAFALAEMTAGIGGIIIASRLGSISNNIDGGQLVLYGVAAAVIGGTSLFGGRGKMIHALVGGLVIATIYNGMGLIGLSADSQLMVTSLVLLASVAIDALARRGSTRP
jgi:D-xylose transport system permease protein